MAAERSSIAAAAEAFRQAVEGLNDALGELQARGLEPVRFEHLKATGPQGKRATPLDRASADVVIEGTPREQLAALQAALADLDGRPAPNKRPARQHDDDTAIAARIHRLRMAG